MSSAWAFEANILSQAKIQTAEEQSASALRELSTLHNTLDVVRDEKARLETSNKGLRIHLSDAEEALKLNRHLRKKKLEALRVEIASQTVQP